MILGIDVSTYLEQQRITNQKYYKDGKEVDPFLVFKNNGVTHLRVRIWNDPYDENGNPYLGGTCDLDNVINLYHTLKKYDFHYLIDFHYSDHWSDPAKQTIPKAWQNHSFEELQKDVYEFTKSSLIKLKEIGIPIDYIQCGNETTRGMLYPIAQLQGGEERKASFKRLCAFYKAGLKAMKEILPEAETIIHLEQSYDIPIYEEYLAELQENNVDFDILGSSYYPFWHHNFDEYFACQDMVREKYHKKTMNVEHGYSWTLEDYNIPGETEEKQMVINSINMEEFITHMPYPPIKEGQAKFIKEFVRLAKEHKMEGIFYWEPIWVPGKGICWASKEAQKYQHDVRSYTRNDWANQCLYDYEANALPAVDEYKTK